MMTATGDTKRETQYINKSLSSLVNSIRAIGESYECSSTILSSFLHSIHPFMRFIFNFFFLHRFVFSSVVVSVPIFVAPFQLQKVKSRSM